MDNLPDDALLSILRHIDSGSQYKAAYATCWRWNRIVREAHPDAEEIMANHLWTMVCRFPDMRWNWSALSKDPRIPLRAIRDTADSRPWNWSMLPLRTDLTWEFILAHKHKDWCWYTISFNPCVTPDILLSHPDMPWNGDGLSYNPNLTWEFIRDNPLKVEWDMYEITQHPCITWKIICDNSDFGWVKDAISSNPNIPWTALRDRPYFRWDARSLSHA